MRNDTPLTGPPAGNEYLGSQTEFKAFALLYARYEVVGMKGEMTGRITEKYGF